MNPFLTPLSERLADWRLLRASLATMDDQHQLTAVASYWAKTPLSIVNDPDHWPTIWEMFHANVWSRNSVAIGMEATLRLAGMASERLTLRLIDMTPDNLLVLVIDDRWLLNYDWGSCRLYTIDHHILRQWRHNGKDYFILDG